jgi:hypothetical protein
MSVNKYLAYSYIFIIIYPKDKVSFAIKRPNERQLINILAVLIYLL